MKNLKDLTPELEKAEAKDKFYAISGVIKRMLAPQDPQLQRTFKYRKNGWGKIERLETTTDGTEESKRAPRARVRIRKGEWEEKTSGCWSFRTVKDKIFRHETILLPWGTDHGLFKKALRRSLEAQRKLRYESAPLSLMKAYPLWLPIGKAPCESMKDGKMPEVVLETRNTQNGKVMVETFFDYVEDRSFICYMEIDSEAPQNEEKLVALVKSLNTLDNIGPSKRGSMQITKIEQVELTAEELKKLECGEPIQPVIY